MLVHPRSAPLDSGHAASDGGAACDVSAATLDSIFPPRSRRAPGHRRAGDVLCGKYELRGRLGSGGMGTVWVAHHLQLNVPVAVKLLHSNLGEPTLAARFENEARILARLVHPAIVRVLDFGRTAEQEPLLVMELLRGEPLAEILDKDGRLGPVVSVQMLLPIASGLAATHDERITHRDLKPDNVFVAVGGSEVLQPKLIDFGIARSLDERPDSRLTRAGGIVGSPEYMAPEQAAGEIDLDHRVDIWGFCALLYECVTGQRLYRMDASYERVLRRIIEEPPRSFAAWGLCEDELWRIVERGLNKNRDARWGSMRELGVALTRWLLARGRATDVTKRSLWSEWGRAIELLEHEPPSASSTAGVSEHSAVSRRRKRPRRLVAATVGALAGVGVAWSAQTHGVFPRPTEASAPAGSARRASRQGEVPAPSVGVEPAEKQAANGPVSDPAPGSIIVKPWVDGHEPSKQREPSGSRTADKAAAPPSGASSRNGSPQRASPPQVRHRRARHAEPEPSNLPAAPSQTREEPSPSRSSAEVFDHDLGF